MKSRTFTSFTLFPACRGEACNREGNAGEERVEILRSAQDDYGYRAGNGTGP
jgi:hypothetical protein